MNHRLLSKYADHEHLQTAALAMVTRSIFALSATTKADDAIAMPLQVQDFARCSLKRRRPPKQNERSLDRPLSNV